MVLVRITVNVVCHCFFYRLLRFAVTDLFVLQIAMNAAVIFSCLCQLEVDTPRSTLHLPLM